MKKVLIWIVVLILLGVGYFVRQEYRNMPITDTMTDEEVMTGEVVDGETITGEVIQPSDGGETGVDPEFMEQMEAQAESQATVEGEELTDEDRKLIEDILQQISDSVQE
jgi:hypothetical protein